MLAGLGGRLTETRNKEKLAKEITSGFFNLDRTRWVCREKLARLFGRWVLLWQCEVQPQQATADVELPARLQELLACKAT